MGNIFGWNLMISERFERMETSDWLRWVVTWLLSEIWLKRKWQCHFKRGNDTTRIKTALHEATWLPCLLLLWIYFIFAGHHCGQWYIKNETSIANVVVSSTNVMATPLKVQLCFIKIPMISELDYWLLSHCSVVQYNLILCNKSISNSFLNQLANEGS